MFEQARCWIDGSIMPAAEAKVSVFDHGFLYGDGAFEGVRFYNGKAFRLPLHLKRLQRSAQALQLAIPLSAGELAQSGRFGQSPSCPEETEKRKDCRSRYP